MSEERVTNETANEYQWDDDDDSQVRMPEQAEPELDDSEDDDSKEDDSKEDNSKEDNSKEDDSMDDDSMDEEEPFDLFIAQELERVGRPPSGGHGKSGQPVQMEGPAGSGDTVIAEDDLVFSIPEEDAQVGSTLHLEASPADEAAVGHRPDPDSDVPVMGSSGPVLAIPDPAEEGIAGSDDTDLAGEQGRVRPGENVVRMPTGDAERDSEESGSYHRLPPREASTGQAVRTSSARRPDSVLSIPGEDEEVMQVPEGDSETPFALPGVQKMGIVGGKGVGKSYLFQAMVYRTMANVQAGAMSHYIERGTISLFSARKFKNRATAENLERFARQYRSWERLPQTKHQTQRWFRLRLPFRTGVLGRSRDYMDVEFFDGSGEGFFEAAMSPENRELWRDGYLDARVMVFCLPIWVAFPGPGMSQNDWVKRDQMIEGFETTVNNFIELRAANNRHHSVRSILALTMTDDRKSALRLLRDRWITPYMDSPCSHLKRLRTGRGVARYLSNARLVSDALHREFEAASEPRAARIPHKLDFNGGRPWLIPLTAIDGSLLEEIEDRYPAKRPHNLVAPVPVHVELPLLVALCDRDNALL